MDNKEFERLLLTVQKPGRYSGGEINSVIKDKQKVDVRFAFCFPDTYEIGMSHLGMKILYSQFNEREDIWCERVYSPWTDLHKVLPEKIDNLTKEYEEVDKQGVPLYNLNFHRKVNARIQ